VVVIDCSCYTVTERFGTTMCRSSYQILLGTSVPGTILWPNVAIVITNFWCYIQFLGFLVVLLVVYALVYKNLVDDSFDLLSIKCQAKITSFSHWPIY